MGREQMTPSAAPAQPEFPGGLERDLERLQGLVDGAVGQLRGAFGRIASAIEAGTPCAQSRDRAAEDVRQILTCLQFHDVATQMISNMRARSVLLERAALVAAPATSAAEHARLLDEASRLARRCPDSWSDQGGDMELF